MSGHTRPSGQPSAPPMPRDRVIGRYELLDLARLAGWPTYRDERGVEIEGRERWSEMGWSYASDRLAAFTFLQRSPLVGGESHNP